MKWRNIFFNLPIIVILVLTLLLLQFIGYAETQRQYTKFELSRLATQAEIIKNGFDSYLQAGLPLKEFSGFTNQSGTLLLSDPSIERIQVFDTRRHLIFSNIQKKLSQPPPEDQVLSQEYKPSHIVLDRDSLVEESSKNFRVTLTLDTRFGLAGYITVESGKADLLSILDKKFNDVFYALIVLVGLFVAGIVIYETFFTHNKNRRVFLKTFYIIEFIIMSVIISVVTFNVYEYGAKASTRALSNSMAQRLSAILDLGIDIRDISYIDKTFLDYQRNNPTINHIALIEKGIAIFHTDHQQINKTYVSSADSFEYIVPLHKQELRVSVSIPIKIVMQAVWKSAKAFIVLFVACALISFIFLEAGTVLITIREQQPRIKGHFSEEDEKFQWGLSLVKPAYFLIVFINALSVSFLPQLVTGMVEKTDSSIASTSLPFSLFYAIFALVLIPAGRYVERGDLKKLMTLGFIAEMIGVTLIALTEDFWLLTIGRVFSGVGQGTFLIGLQSYILSITPKDKQTQGSAVKVVGRNAGMIAGTSIGALLFVYLDYHTIFTISSLLTLASTLYLWKLVPKVEEIAKVSLTRKEATQKNFLQEIIIVLKDGEFFKSLTLIGIMSKIGIAGVVMFAVPLLLSRRGFASEDIGLALMFFYTSSMLTTYLIARLVDKTGKTCFVLSLSAWVGGLGMLLLGFLGVHTWNGQAFYGMNALVTVAANFNAGIVQLGLVPWESYLIFFFLILTGISNGLSTAPLQTHINKTEVAKNHGKKSVNATYTFLERGGHVLGPMLVSSLLTFSNQSMLAISIVGVLTIVTGLLFQLLSRHL